MTLDSKSVVRRSQLLAHPLHLVALGLGQVQAGPAVIAHGLGQQLGILAFELGLPVGIGFERLVDVLPIINADRPLLQLLEGVGGGIAQRGLGAGFLDQPEAVSREADLIADVIQRADGVLEGDLAGLEGADAVQSRVAHRDRLLEREAELVGRGLEVGQANDALKLGRALLELLQRIRAAGILGKSDARAPAAAPGTLLALVSNSYALNLRAFSRQASRFIPSAVPA